MGPGPRAGCAAAALAALAACAAQPPSGTGDAASRCGGRPMFAAGGERATLWARDSAEYRATTESIYRAALAALAEALADPAWSAEPGQGVAAATLPPAIVMDIDETVLDNSPAQAEMLLEGICLEDFPAFWDAWIARQSAPAIPGAAGFIRAVRAMRDPAGRPVRIFFITNRECARRAGTGSACPQQDDTAANLRALGLGGDALPEELMLRAEQPEWGSEKLARRQAVAQAHRIVLNVGDDLADFLPEVRRASPREREQARCDASARWGTQWFMLPNPMYGSWLVALGPGLDAALTAGSAAGVDCPAP